MLVDRRTVRHDQPWWTTWRDCSASANVHVARPRSATSLIRNCPVDDSTGKPPADISPTPGVVNRKLIVATNSPIAITLPTADTRGHQGLTASSPAAPT